MALSVTPKAKAPSYAGSPVTYRLPPEVLYRQCRFNPTLVFVFLHFSFPFVSRSVYSFAF